MKISPQHSFWKRYGTFLIIAALYLTYSLVFLKPWTVKNFSLIDDGQVLMQNASYLEACVSKADCSNFLAQTLEWGTGRVRPTYWLIQDFVYEVFRNNVVYHHTSRVFLLGFMIVMLMAYVLIRMKLRSIPIILSTTLFFTSFSFSENIIRLGPNEPFQVLFLLIFSAIYLSLNSLEELGTRKFILLVLFLIIGVFIKESNISILPAIFFTELFLRRKVGLRLFTLVGLPIICFVGYMILGKIFPFKLLSDIPAYTSNYLTNPFTILENGLLILQILLNTLSPFLKTTILILPIFVVSKIFRNNLLDKNFVYWSLFSIFFIGIMFPWKYILDRYQLMGIMGLTVFICLVFSKVLDFLQSRIINKTKYGALTIILFNLTTGFVLINMFSRGFSLNLAKTINYRSWYSQFTQFEHDQVKAILKYNDKEIFINGNDSISNWEFLYEIPIHFNFLYGQKSNVLLLTKKPLVESYVFSRSSFDSFTPLDEISRMNSQILESNTYIVPQIDPLVFRDKFVMKPVETIINPPLQKEGYNYYWEIRQIKK